MPVVRTLRFHCRGRGPSLVSKLRSHMPCSMAKKKKKKRSWEGGIEGGMVTLSKP